MASRAKRLEEIVLSSLGTAKDEVEALKDELQEWLDNMPENLQGSSKAEALEEAIGQLEATMDSIDEAIENAGSVEFPGMF